MSSILTSVKKSLGLDEAYTAFDPDVTMYINGVLATLNQLGIGPDNGFQIADKTSTWESFLGTDPRLNFVPSYVLMRVRLLFDPPATSFGIQAIEAMIKEYEFRISTYREVSLWTPVV